MTEETQTPATAQKGLTIDQVRMACAAGHEVLTGARSDRILELGDQLTICRSLLQQIASGRLTVVPTPDPSKQASPSKAAEIMKRAGAPIGDDPGAALAGTGNEDPPPSNRKARRAAAAQAKKKPSKKAVRRTTAAKPS